MNMSKDVANDIERVALLIRARFNGAHGEVLGKAGLQSDLRTLEQLINQLRKEADVAP